MTLSDNIFCLIRICYTGNFSIFYFFLHCFNSRIPFILRDFYLHRFPIMHISKLTIFVKTFIYTSSTILAIFRLNISSIYNSIRTVFYIIITDNFRIMTCKLIIQSICSFCRKTMSLLCMKLLFII